MDCHRCASQPCQSDSRPRLFQRLIPRPPDLVESPESHPRVILVGMPNVGKSVLFHALTGTYVTVSNYPGTTVELSQGHLQLADQRITVIDTPGMYSLLPLTDEERVTREVLLSTPSDLLLHVVDAKNLSRMLPLTVQLIEAGFPVLLVLNMMDEAQQLGLIVDLPRLETALEIPVVATAAAHRQGIDHLKQRMVPYVQSHHLSPAR